MPLNLLPPYVAAATQSGNTDPYYSSVSYLLTGEELADVTGKVTFTTGAGNPVLVTTPVKFGSRSMSCDSSKYFISSANTNTMSFGTGDFTVEAWGYLTNANDWRTIVSSRNNTAAVAGRFSISVSSSRQVSIWSSGEVLTSPTNTVPLTTWTLITVVRRSGVLTIYVNGTSVASTNDTNNYVDNFFAVAATTNGAQPWVGFFDGIRITKGYARYTGNFTVPTIPFAP